jgi:hypothetical protein
MDHYSGQQREGWLELLPDPDGQNFAGGILQSRDVIEVVMIKAVVQGFEGGLDVAEIHHPAGIVTNFPADMDFDAKRVAVQSGAFVPRRHLGQTVRCFDGERFENVQSGFPIRYVFCSNLEMLAASGRCGLAGGLRE